MEKKTIQQACDEYKTWLRATENRPEMYKWEATKWFQDNWNIDAPDFYAMMKKAFAKRGNLLYKYAWTFINAAAQHKPEELRSLFRNLLDESKDLQERMRAFKVGSGELLKKILEILDRKMVDAQDERSIAFYLAMAHPGEHYLFMDKYYQNFSLAMGETPKKDASGKYLHFRKLVEKLKTEQSMPSEEICALQKNITPEELATFDDTNLIIQNILYNAYARQAVRKQAVAEDASWWLYSPGQQAEYWEECLDERIMSIGWGALGDLRLIHSQDEITKALRQIKGKPDADFRNDSLACWQFANEIQEGDYIVAKKGRGEYKGIGIVKSGYRFEAERTSQPHVRTVEWIKDGSWSAEDDPIPTKTLTKFDAYPEILAAIRSRILDAEDEEPLSQRDPGTTRPHNYILYGPPGTGKTYSSAGYALDILEGRQLGQAAIESRSLMMKRYEAAVEEGRITFITLHQSYSYEEFVEGIRPMAEEGGIRYETKKGVFAEICGKA